MALGSATSMVMKRLAFLAFVCMSSETGTASAGLDEPSSEASCGAGLATGATSSGSGAEVPRRVAQEHLLMQVGQSKASAAKLEARRKDVGDTTEDAKAEQDFWERIRRTHYGAFDMESERINSQDAGAPAAVASSPGIGAQSWCHRGPPEAGWSRKSCPSTGKVATTVLTYNLFWWNLFNQRGGGHAGALIAENGPYDFMGFQECDNVGLVLQHAERAGLLGRYGTIQGGHALGMAYDESRWTVLEAGVDDVAEDQREQYYGKRGVQWARLRQRDGDKTVTFFNHHGPLRVGTGGQCGRHATAWNLLHAIRHRARDGDSIVLVGDFNAPKDNLEIEELEARLHLVLSGDVMGRIDHVFSNCGTGANAENLGNGGSDHDALRVTIHL